VGLAIHQRSSFHSSTDQWLHSVRGLLERTDEAFAGTLRLVEALDLGGGFTAEGLDALLSGETGQNLLSFVRTSLPNCDDIILEPGRSLVQAYGSVVSSVIATGPDRQVIVDASLAELPWPVHETRPVYVYRRHEWLRLRAGFGILAGRTTMETDILASNIDVSALRVGDVLCFAEAGAYDVSMRNRFCAGTIVET
jgi:diaminopimelate decarboxylase